MPDATPLAAALGRGDRTVAEIAARRDELLAKIEDDDLIPQWAWGPLTDTLSSLASLGDDLAWITTAYLSAVVHRGAKMFHPAARQLAINAEADTLPCRCGADAPADPLVRRGSRLVRTARCPCGLDLVVYDEEPYDRPTLLSAAFV